MMNDMISKCISNIIFNLVVSPKRMSWLSKFWGHPHNKKLLENFLKLIARQSVVMGFE